MTIRKYLHSCILLEENGKKILIDPGAYSFVEGKIKPSDIGKVDVLIYTHKHADHFEPKIIKEFIKNDTKIIVSADIGEVLQREGISFTAINEGQEISEAGFKIKSLPAPHEEIPTEIPHNFAYLINDRFLHPGDSLSVTGINSCEILALPVAGPWNKLIEALRFALRLKPRTVIPIHDVIVKDFLLQRIYEFMCGPWLKKSGIEFKPLDLGDKVEV